MVPFAKLADEKRRMYMTLLVALKWGGVEKWRVTDVVVVFGFPYLLAKDEGISFITYVSSCCWAEFVCDAGVYAAQLRYYLAYSGSFFAKCSAAPDVEQLLERL